MKNIMNRNGKAILKTLEILFVGCYFIVFYPIEFVKAIREEFNRDPLWRNTEKGDIQNDQKNEDN